MRTGKVIRLQRLAADRLALTVPLDDSLISGPIGGLNAVEHKIEDAVAGGADSILAFYGLLKRHSLNHRCLGRIANISASTTRSFHTRKQLVSSVESAVINGFDAVACHLNLTSRHEPEMLSMLGQVQRESEKFEMPLLVICYPRRETDTGDDNYYDLKQADPERYTELVKHCVRLAVELGADVVKTQYTGTSDSFADVVSVGYDVPIWIAGGPKVRDEDAVAMAEGALAGGARGLCFGRQAYQRDNTRQFVGRLRQIITHYSGSIEQCRPQAELPSSLVPLPESVRPSQSNSPDAATESY